MKKRQMQSYLVTAFILTGALLAGCSNNQVQPRTNQLTGTPGPTPVRMAKQDQANNLRPAENIASALVGKHNIRRANVFVVGQTAYVAVDIPETAQRNLTDQIKTSVANEARRVDPNLQRVFVSADPDVYQRFQGFNNDLQAGHPIQGIYNRFTELIQRVFPQPK